MNLYLVTSGVKPHKSYIVAKSAAEALETMETEPGKGKPVKAERIGPVTVLPGTKVFCVTYWDPMRWPSGTRTHHIVADSMKDAARAARDAKMRLDKIELLGEVLNSTEDSPEGLSWWEMEWEQLADSLSKHLARLEIPVGPDARKIVLAYFGAAERSRRLKMDERTER